MAFCRRLCLRLSFYKIIDLKFCSLKYKLNGKWKSCFVISVSFARCLIFTSVWLLHRYSHHIGKDASRQSDWGSQTAVFISTYTSSKGKQCSQWMHQCILLYLFPLMFGLHGLLILPNACVYSVHLYMLLYQECWVYFLCHMVRPFDQHPHVCFSKIVMFSFQPF